MASRAAGLRLFSAARYPASSVPTRHFEREQIGEAKKGNSREDMENFGDILEQSLAGGAVQQGEIVKGTVVAIDRDTVTVDIGFKAEGMIPLREFFDPKGDLTVKPGDDIDVFVESMGDDTGQVRLSYQ
jgi:small subunit ribosomal protein S1